MSLERVHVLLRTSYLTRLFTGLVIAISVPGIACYGWYATESAGNTTAAVRTLVIVAYPVALAALASLVQAPASPTHRRYQAWISAMSLVVALVIVVLSRS